MKLQFYALELAGASRSPRIWHTVTNPFYCFEIFQVVAQRGAALVNLSLFPELRRQS